MDTERPLKHIENIEEFINHNLKLGYLKSDMTIIELLQFIKNIKENYIPMITQIEDSIEFLEGKEEKY